MKYNIADLDIDVKDRDEVLKHFKHIPASKINDKGINPHGVGVYFSDVPQDLITGLCSVDYKSAEENFGYIKIDLLHNTQYDSFNTRDELLETMNKPIHWELLKNKEFVENLPHIGSYFDLLQTMPEVDSIEKLAMLIAIIRPAKNYLIKDVQQSGWNSIKDKIWIKEDSGFQFKKSHSISYALMISISMRN